MDINKLTIEEAKEIAALFGVIGTPLQVAELGSVIKPDHPMLGKRCLVRTYSAGVHIGNVEYVDGMECKLTDALRLWQWKDGGLSLSAVANNGIKSGRLNYTGEVYLTNVIEYIPTTLTAEETYARFIEDKK